MRITSLDGLLSRVGIALIFGSRGIAPGNPRADMMSTLREVTDAHALKRFPLGRGWLYYLLFILRCLSFNPSA